MAKPSKKNLALAAQTGESNPQAPLDWQAFLAAAAPVMKVLKADLGQRQKASPAVSAALLTRYEADKADRKTADSQIEWTERFIEQVAAAWMLSCVFIRTLEDRGLLSHARLAGPGAADSFKAFLELAPSLNERDYLLTVFRELRHFPATRGLFDARHNPVWLLTPSADGAKALIALFTGPNREAPAFRFGQADTAFLGWLYQDLDEGVRARFALLQTPRFVEAFILDRTLEPALATFGLGDTTLIDPTCGSGHFLLGAFERLFSRWIAAEPGLGERSAAHKALDAVYGADINPYAVAIARFRLTLAFLERGGFKRLTGAPPLHVVVADSLLHNPHVQQIDLAYVPTADAYMAAGAAYRFENDTDAREVLHRRFAAVVGNPPYITVKDAVLRDRYRELYPRSAAGKYSIAAPFTERFFQLAKAGGRIGMITANSFMKREFGKKLIEQYLPSVNLDAVINTSGAYIPGHGTPTVLLFGTNEPPKGTDVLTVLANRGEPSTPADPEQGQVWRSIADHWQDPGFENDYISVARTSRDTLGKHPWSLGGGGAAELKELLEERAEKRLGDWATDIGFDAIMGEDDIFVGPEHWVARVAEPERRRQIVTGEVVRDWSIATDLYAYFPYDHELMPSLTRSMEQHAWRYRTRLIERRQFGKNTLEAGLKWFEYRSFYKSKRATPLSIAFAEVASHNHFVLDRGGKVFKQTAPIIKLPPNATEDDHLALLAYLNSSTACFLMKQVSHQKQMMGGDGIRVSDASKVPYQFAGTALGSMPLPAFGQTDSMQLARLAREMEALVAIRARPLDEAATRPDRLMERAQELASEAEDALRRMVWIQEEIDWIVYAAFGLVERDTTGASMDDSCGPGQRPFAILEGGPVNNEGFPVSHPTSMSDHSLRVFGARMKAIRSLAHIKVVETTLYKRRWIGRQGLFNHGRTGGLDEHRTHAKESVLDDLEGAASNGSTPFAVQNLSGLGAHIQAAATFGWQLESEPASPFWRQVLEAESMPFLAAYRFTETGLEKHAAWEKTWELQRREDTGENVGPIPVPPKCAQGDYRAASAWQLRGPLDVPKERFISYPGCESDEDHEPVYGWAGWDHEQRAKALATLYWQRKTDEQWPKDRLTPMLAGLLELLPWLKQWHADPSDDYGGDSPAAYFAGFLDTECRAFDLTHTELRAWRPPEKTRGKKATTPKAPKTPKPESDGTPEKKPRAPRKPRTPKTTTAPDGPDGDTP